MMNEIKDYVKERAVENSVLFRQVDYDDLDLLMSVSNKAEFNKHENIGEEKREVSGRKR